MLLIRFFLLLVLCLLSWTGYTQINQQYIFHHFGLQEGLLSDETNATAQDAKGYIWIAGKNGLQQEFDNLKDKINPHFLFNCFNTLSSLISENKAMAGRFLNELSKVYRYLLQNNEEGMSTVESEMKFIRSYFQLISTRYGEGVQLNIQIDKKYYPYLVPSLSPQLLVENAVKHNVVSKHTPLSIEIFTTEGKQLVVNNNLNRKSDQGKINPPSV